MVAGVILVAAGLITMAYSSTQLSGQTTLYDQSSVQVGSHSYIGQGIALSLDGKYQPVVKGGVGSVGCCVDFYLVSDANWNAWSTDPAMRDALSAEHLNSTIVSSQSLQGQFTFTPSSLGCSVVFLNDEYPNATGARSVHATITLHYTPLASLCALLGGFGVTVLGLGLLFVIIRRGALAIES